MDSPKPNFFPELADDGAILLMNLPVNDVWGKTGQMIQVAYKTVFQAAMLPGRTAKAAQ